MRSDEHEIDALINRIKGGLIFVWYGMMWGLGYAVTLVAVAKLAGLL
jgi:hypothetical protein